MNKTLIGTFLIIISTYLMSKVFRRIFEDSKRPGSEVFFDFLKELIFGLPGFYLLLFIFGIVVLMN